MRLLRCSIQKGSPERGAGTRSVTEGFCFPAEIIFLRKRLVNERKTWYDNSIEANNKAGHGRSEVTHAPMQYTIAFATPAPIITVFPSFFNSHFLTSLLRGTVLQYGVCVCTYAVWGNYILHRFLFVSAGNGPAGRGRKSPPRPGPTRRDFVSIWQKL